MQWTSQTHPSQRFHLKPITEGIFHFLRDLHSLHLTRKQVIAAISYRWQLINTIMQPSRGSWWVHPWGTCTHSHNHTQTAIHKTGRTETRTYNTIKSRWWDFCFVIVRCDIALLVPSKWSHLPCIKQMQISVTVLWLFWMQICGHAIIVRINPVLGN